MEKQKIQVAIDGPASAGKSTVAKLVAKNFGYIYCDTGAMYRSVTLKAIQNHLSLSDESTIVAMLKQTKISFTPGNPVQHVFVDDKEVTEDIRQPNITNSVSTIASLAGVRTELVNRQREIANQNSIVMDGRDIGTAVLPNAPVKIFLIASVSERAERRYKENIAKGIETPLAQLKKEIEVRDHKDSTRKVSPLTKAKDAIEVDTTSMTIEQVVNEITKIINQRIK
ncbi:(d)CMP kinase [Pediococcus ethanolidurans]|uniref:Cytidylate kinase n=1 Tax=Pediococcus ethanolidurans TaxID=319653 RepID=A0A0R2JZ78_9LACO|nr:(d)CMP kinase [Pediococcus ethanolidurans]KRN82536.1 cytidylate kinase [Pediococcus ethanolidurans]MBU7555341.1 (d)CMP kinase [Pediococcus ethanolidurans]MBU7563943.1 (d)CMP kinase [Pediococcus ethanolidurans]MCT4397767.1 (d)CMP kinase [Pediococcus ethanolidurans]MCV3315371.1 (d)CMP kinase [Pediococcus ethanolidurans]